MALLHMKGRAMLKPYIGFIKVSLIIGVLAIAAYFIRESGKDSVRADMADAVRIATENARKIEQEKQEKINAIAQHQQNELQNINTKLLDNIKRLHNRPNKRHVPKDNKATCEGATGAELSRPDASFLTREAARADTIRTALKACYKYADEVSGTLKQ